MLVDNFLTGAMVLSGLATGIFLHEATHFAVGAAMGTVRQAGIVYSNTDGFVGKIPLAAFISQSHRNWASTLAPLVWFLPFYFIFQLPPTVPPLAYLFGVCSLGFAASAVLLSDIPVALGLIDYTDEDAYRRLILVDYT